MVKRGMLHDFMVKPTIPHVTLFTKLVDISGFKAYYMIAGSIYYHFSID